MLSTDEFTEFAKSVVPFLHVTTHIPDDPHDTMLLEKGGAGWPYLAWLDADGDVMLPHKGDRSTKGLQKGLAELPEAPMRKLKAKATTDAAMADYLIAQLESEWMGSADAAERVAKIAKLAPEKKKRLDDLIVTRDVTECTAKARTDAQSIEVAKHLFDLAKQKRVPTDEKIRTVQWNLIFRGLGKAKDAKLLESAIAEAKRSLGNDSKSRKTLEKAEEMLADLKKGAKTSKP
ncbi:MAG TPA: hypothetical protein VKE69_11095 [Planctomycetota bacterium]|nr:hypothetical protein [Planctomycetota bacterium]